MEPSSPPFPAAAASGPGKGAASDLALLHDLWPRLGDPAIDLPRIELSGPRSTLPSIFDVSGLATASVAAATAALAEWLALAPDAEPPTVHVERAQAAVAFRSERHLKPRGWTLPPVWDPIAGDYETRDGWIRLHTNYAHHRAAALAVLRVAAERDAVAAAVRREDGEALEQAIVEAGGCAAMMRTRDEWLAHPQGLAVAQEPLCELRETSDRVAPRLPRTAYGAPADRRLTRDDAPRPLSGLRVLDLTRVIAGPVCTRFLAAWGADVLRIDPPGFEESLVVLADTTAGKRCAALDLRREADRATFEGLVAGADVLVHGYRPDALARLGYDETRLRALAPHLVRTSLCAYGHTGPWSGRRGFDSLVQMSCGLAARGQEAAAAPRPTPLPAQALDHGTGYLMAAATLRALSALHREGRRLDVRLSLARTAEWLWSLGEVGDPGATPPDDAVVDAAREELESGLGRLAIVRCPGRLGRSEPRWERGPGATGRDEPRWTRSPSAAGTSD